jgi:hypothetical protein
VNECKPEPCSPRLYRASAADAQGRNPRLQIPVQKRLRRFRLQNDAPGFRFGPKRQESGREERETRRRFRVRKEAQRASPWPRGYPVQLNSRPSPPSTVGCGVTPAPAIRAESERTPVHFSSERFASYHSCLSGGREGNEWEEDAASVYG